MISDGLIQEFDFEMANTRKLLERVPDDKLTWTPHPKSMNLGGLATHVAKLPEWGILILTSDSFDVAPEGAEQPHLEALPSRQAMLDEFDSGIATVRSALAATTDEQWLQPWSLLAGGKVLFTMPRIACFRGFVMNHLIHHRAQLGVYLRMNDVPLPQMYGPTADEAGM